MVACVRIGTIVPVNTGLGYDSIIKKPLPNLFSNFHWMAYMNFPFRQCQHWFVFCILFYKKSNVNTAFKARRFSLPRCSHFLQRIQQWRTLDKEMTGDRSDYQRNNMFSALLLINLSMIWLVSIFKVFCILVKCFISDLVTNQAFVSDMSIRIGKCYETVSTQSNFQNKFIFQVLLVL